MCYHFQGVSIIIIIIIIIIIAKNWLSSSAPGPWFGLGPTDSKQTLREDDNNNNNNNNNNNHDNSNHDNDNDNNNNNKWYFYSAYPKHAAGVKARELTIIGQG